MRFVQSGKVDAAANDAAQTVKGPDGEALRRAAEGARPRRPASANAHGEDPQVKNP
jgi:hypothetical protein